jgi:hypothetical protein
VLNSAASWPEPLATLLMIVVSFLSAVVCYREYLHIGVGVLPAFLHEPAKSYLGWILEMLMLATNLFNLLDLRPGRSVKAFVLLGVALMIGERDLTTFEHLGLFIGPLLVAGVFDVRELAMLGDTGSNLTGALAGLWLVLALGTTGQVIALVVLALITAYGEFRSISGLVDRTPGLSHLDSIGRINH